MTSVLRQASIAGERLPHGSLVRLDGEQCFPAELERSQAVTCRPAIAVADWHEAGEGLQVQTEGGILAALADGPGWVVISGGRVRKPEPVF